MPNAFGSHTHLSTTAPSPIDVLLATVQSAVSYTGATVMPGPAAPSHYPLSYSSNLSPVTSPSLSVELSLENVRSIAAPINGSICLGKGLDVTTIGVLFSILFSFVVGLGLWLLFGYLRPRFRQVYAVREWFLAPEFRPKPLRRTFWAFLRPRVPFVPALPNDVSSFSYGSNPEADAAHFPSDDELAQRTLWHIFLIVLSWTIVGLGGALPLYLIGTPCLADTMPSELGGYYSTLHDLSFLRLLNLLGSVDGELNPDHAKKGYHRLFKRVTNETPNIEIRLIVLTILVVLAAILAACKFMYEFTQLGNYRRLWIDVKCGGMELGWLSKTKAQGFEGWGENELKEFLIASGLSKGFMNSSGPRAGFAGVGANGRSAGGCSGNRTAGDEGTTREAMHQEVDLRGLYTVADTTRLSVLMRERDMVLNNLEVAETQYINSFRLSTPLPSVIDFEIPDQFPASEAAMNNGLKHHISRPRALIGSSNYHVRHHRRKHGYDASAAPTSYVAPSHYYQLRDIRGIGRISTDGTDNSLAQRISQRVIGSRFQEIHRDSLGFGRIPIGSHVQLDDRTGTLGPVRFSQDQLRHGPNNPLSGNEADLVVSNQPELDASYVDPPFRESSGGEYSAEAGPSTAHGEGEWTPTVMGSDEFAVRPRPPKPQHPPAPPDQRSTFPMRAKLPCESGDIETVPPPHLRLQSQQPFVRPVSGMDHDDLGAVYGEIRVWRSRLKAINIEIAEAQAENFSYIADGVNIKGWLLIGRGVRYIPHVQMIEGRSKEDIRYDELQGNGGTLSVVTFWTIAGMVTILLGASLIAVSGLVMSPAPKVVHYLTFLKSLSDKGGFGVAVATTFIPSVAALFFLALALFVIHCASRFCGFVSVSSARITAFKAFFIVSIACCIWLTVCGSLLFALNTFAIGVGRPRSVASGSVYFAAFLLILVIMVAIISPAILMIQPLRLLRIVRHQRSVLTPRQRFRATYPRAYDPTYSSICSLVAVSFASTFSLIFPVIGPPVCLLLFLTLIAHRYLFAYVYVQTDFGHTGGLLQIWLLRQFADLSALQPLLLGLILLTRRLWILGGILVGVAVIIVFAVEGYAWYQLRLPSFEVLGPIVQNSLLRFKQAAQSEKVQSSSEDQTPASSLRRAVVIPRNSMASVLEMMSLTLAVMPSSGKLLGPIPLQTEHLDDLSATEQAARTNPNAPPRLPPLPFTTHFEEMQSILYAPELISPPPVIWLPKDHSGVAQSEAIDLFRYHELKTTLDVVSSIIPMPQSNVLRRRDVTTT